RAKEEASIRGRGARRRRKGTREARRQGTARERDAAGRLATHVPRLRLLTALLCRLQVCRGQQDGNGMKLKHAIIETMDRDLLKAVCDDLEIHGIDRRS